MIQVRLNRLLRVEGKWMLGKILDDFIDATLRDCLNLPLVHSFLMKTWGNKASGRSEAALG